MTDRVPWVVTEGHARKMLKALRYAIKTSRERITSEERMNARNLETLNAVKAKMYAEGWTEE